MYNATHHLTPPREVTSTWVNVCTFCFVNEHGVFENNLRLGCMSALSVASGTFVISCAVGAAIPLPPFVFAVIPPPSFALAFVLGVLSSASPCCMVALPSAALAPLEPALLLPLPPVTSLRLRASVALPMRKVLRRLPLGLPAAAFARHSASLLR